MNRRIRTIPVIVVVLLALAITPAMAIAAPPSMPHEAGCAQSYVVQKGDSLAKIGRRFATTTAHLQQLNGIANPDRIYAGQPLCVRGESEYEMGTWYTVQRGDTVSSIARRHGVRVSTLVAANRLTNPNRITVGQRLWVPGAAVSTPTIRLSPNNGGAHTPVTVAGNGFPTGSTATVHLGPPNVGATPQGYGSAVVSANGTFSLDFVMPATWPDGRPIDEREIVVLVVAGGANATAPFLYQPTAPPAVPGIRLSPNSGGMDTPVAVNGVGFPPGAAVEVRLGVPNVGATPQVYGTGTVRGDGTFDLTFSMPAAWPDGRPISEREIVVLVSGGGVSTTAPFLYQPLS